LSSTNDLRFGLSVRHGTRARTTAAHIYLQRIERHANGMLGVTPVCSSLPEIEAEITHLKDDLDEMLRQARRTFVTSERAAV
jgi:hypothetical protein